MTDWMIATPAWGERCVNTFLTSALPALFAALQRINGRVRFLVHTDKPCEISQALKQFEHKTLPVFRTRAPHISMGLCNRQALMQARIGEAIALLNADHVCSVEIFEAAQKRFEEGRRLIVMTGTRTLEEFAPPPAGIRSRELLRWAWDHQHPWITGCTWPTGRSKSPSLIHFMQGDNVVLHGFHLHPFALLKTKNIGFSGITADQDLFDSFSRDEIHVITSADEAALIEISPPNHCSENHEQANSRHNIAGWATSPNKTTAMHRWLFTHRIVMSGDGRDIGNSSVCADILAEIENPPSAALQRARRRRR